MGGTQIAPIAATFISASKIHIDFNSADIQASNRFQLRLTENFATDDTLHAAMPVRIVAPSPFQKAL
jgi:hypothetical protein